MKLAAVLVATVAALFAASCQSDRQMTVEDVLKDIHRLDGKTVRVAGYLGECFGYDCMLYRDESHQKQAVAWFDKVRDAARRRADLPPGDPHNSALAIGGGELDCVKNEPGSCSFTFDREAAPSRNSYVLITGKVTDQCRDEQGNQGCIDRASDLDPISVRPWERPGSGAGVQGG